LHLQRLSPVVSDERANACLHIYLDSPTAQR
jgi:hypothetical protein